MTTFRNLTQKQHQVFEQIAIGNNGDHNYAAIKALLKRGLVESYTTDHVDRFGTFKVNHYQVPLPIHIEWCEWCIEQVEE